MLRFDDTLVPPHLFVLYFPNVTLVLLLTENCLFNVTNTGPSTAKTPRCRGTLRSRITTERHDKMCDTCLAWPFM